MSDSIRIVEVAPRDGLQNESTRVSTADKVELIARLAGTGLRCIEATSFVSPRWVPQLADAEQVMAALPRADGVQFPVLVPNVTGYTRARASGARHIAVFTAASEAFNQRNINASIDQSLERIAEVMALARADGVPVRGYVSTVLGCPYQGEVAVAEVVRVARSLVELGCSEISLGDTIGVGTPAKARQMLLAVAGEVPMAQLAVHFHDTWGQALANVLACIEAGVRVVDAAVGGTGGCPYARGASGNLATEELVYMLHGMGMQTGVELETLASTGRWLATRLGRQSGSKVGKALADA
jgi:hydroxymethylglutaryl-CoA lyase